MFEQSNSVLFEQKNSRREKYLKNSRYYISNVITHVFCHGSDSIIYYVIGCCKNRYIQYVCTLTAIFQHTPRTKST